MIVSEGSWCCLRDLKRTLDFVLFLLFIICLHMLFPKEKWNATHWTWEKKIYIYK